MISNKEVIEFQNNWANGIIKISKKYQEKSDYINETVRFVDNLYAYNEKKVLFKPTLATNPQFRLDKEGAISYFIGNNIKYNEDSGFAIKGWKKIIWENIGIEITDSCAICMGNYYFDNEVDPKLKVEFTIVLQKINNCLKLILHDSHLPYKK